MTPDHFPLRKLALITFLLAACATSGKFKQQMDGWVGGDINQAIMQFGPPSTTYKLPNGALMYSWLRVGKTRVVSNYNAYVNLTTTQARTDWCQISFTADTIGHIQAWQANGPSCKSR
jgi:hypothetical protein